MPEYSDLYQLLGVPQDASNTVIKQAYRHLMQKWHPDKHQTGSAQQKRRAEVMAKNLNRAYDILSKQRKQYDGHLRAKEARKEAQRTYSDEGLQEYLRKLALFVEIEVLCRKLGIPVFADWETRSEKELRKLIRDLKAEEAKRRQPSPPPRANKGGQGTEPPEQTAVLEPLTNWRTVGLIGAFIGGVVLVFLVTPYADRLLTSSLDSTTAPPADSRTRVAEVPLNTPDAYTEDTAPVTIMTLPDTGPPPPPPPPEPRLVCVSGRTRTDAGRVSPIGLPVTSSAATGRSAHWDCSDPQTHRPRPIVMNADGTYDLRTCRWCEWR